MKETLMKVVNWMKKVHNKLFGWMKVSNRQAHRDYGIDAFVIASVISVVVQLLTSNVLVIAGTTGICTATAALAAVEFIQSQNKLSKWDWLDILAGLVYPIIVMVFVVVISWIKG